MITNTIDLASLQNQRAKYMEYRDETARLASIYKDHPLGGELKEHQRILEMAIANIDKAIAMISEMKGT
jgi:hypothetical protein